MTPARGPWWSTWTWTTRWSAIAPEDYPMDSKPLASKPGKRAAPAPEDVDAFIAALDHPHKPEILALRQVILGADPAIAEGIKWNAPSFRTSEWFGTFHLRAKEGVQVILHLGAKKRADAGEIAAIADPEGLLEWLAADRATVKFSDLADVEARGPAFAAVVRRWIKHVRA
jgi:hypothetical protein